MTNDKPTDPCPKCGGCAENIVLFPRNNTVYQCRNLRNRKSNRVRKSKTKRGWVANEASRSTKRHCGHVFHIENGRWVIHISEKSEGERAYKPRPPLNFAPAR